MIARPISGKSAAVRPGWSKSPIYAWRGIARELSAIVASRYLLAQNAAAPSSGFGPDGCQEGPRHRAGPTHYNVSKGAPFAFFRFCIPDHPFREQRDWRYIAPCHRPADGL